MGVEMPTSDPHPVADDLGHRIQVRRVQLRMSRQQLAATSGLHPTYIGDIEGGHRNLTLLTILRLAKALEVRPGELLDGLETYDLGG
jgi:transcriptional regulator with XRE-family HTH domain